MKKIKVLSKGQITLPKTARIKYNINIGDMLIMEETKKGIIIKKTSNLLDKAGTIKLKKNIRIKDVLIDAKRKIGKKNA